MNAEPVLTPAQPTPTERTSTNALPPLDAVGAALWQTVEERWDEDGPHEALLRQASDARQLAAVAARYRALLGTARDTQAQRRLKAITALAIAQLESLKPGSSGTRKKSALWPWTLLALAAGLGLMWLNLRR